MKATKIKPRAATAEAGETMVGNTARIAGEKARASEVYAKGEEVVVLGGDGVQTRASVLEPFDWLGIPCLVLKDGDKTLRVVAERVLRRAPAAPAKSKAKGAVQTGSKR